jgi:hypothetical protein
MQCLSAEAVARFRGGLPGAVELVLDHEVVELVQSILCLVGFLAEVLQQRL